MNQKTTRSFTALDTHPISRKMPLPTVPGTFVYLLECGVSHRTYIGVTDDIVHRLRQHNGAIKGGAKYTSRTNPVGQDGTPAGRWSPRVLVFFPKEGISPATGEPIGPKAARTNALKFEWRAKRAKTGKRWFPINGLDRRRKRILTLLNEESTKATPAVLVLDAYRCPADAVVPRPSVCDGAGYIDHIMPFEAPPSAEEPDPRDGSPDG